MTVRRYDEITEYFHVNDRRAEPAQGTRDNDTLYQVREVIIMAKHNTNPMDTWQSPSTDTSKFGWDMIQYTCIYFWPTLTSTLGKGRKHLNMVWDTNLLHSWQGKSLKMFPCWVLQLFHKCPTNEWFDNRYNIRLWNCKNESERVPGWPEGSLSTSNRPVKRQMRSINEFVWQDKTPVAFPSTLRNPRGQVPLTRQHVRQELRMT